MAQVLTGAIALVKVRGDVVGRLRSISVQENLGRGTVKGIGSIYTIEAPIIDHAGTITVEAYEVDWKLSPITGAILRQVQTNQQFQDQLTLLEGGVQIDIFKKVLDIQDPNTGLVIPGIEPFATITRVLIDGEGFDISEGAIAGRRQSFRFLDPILIRK
jgi:hypothetical protein